MKSKKWAAVCLVLTGLILVLTAAAVVVIDPAFHFHAPISGVAYQLRDERYQNDGIVRFFDYDAIITGTSMTENFKASEFDELFGATTIKVPYSGGTFREINDNLERAFAADPDIKYVLRSLDSFALMEDKDAMTYDNNPYYLYDDSLLNDVNYILNKDILFRHVLEDLAFTVYGADMTDFDEYANWMGDYEDRDFGKDAVLALYERPEQSRQPHSLTVRERTQLQDNLAQNVTAIAQAHPETEFYLFFPPYSVVWWDSLQRNGYLARQIDIQHAAAEQMLACDNIRLFSFCDAFDVVTDLSLYKDTEHFNENISSQLLRWMRDGEHELTRDNLDDYLARIDAFYSSYDYDGLFA